MAAGGDSQTGMQDSALPWDAMMGFAFGRLRLLPDMFWRMTLKEFGYLAGNDPGAAMPDRAMLAILMQRYPDEHRSPQGLKGNGG